MTGLVASPRTVLRTAPVAPATESAGEAATSGTAVWPVALSRVLAAVTLAGVWVLAYVYVLSSFQAAHAQAGLYAQFRTQLALGTAPIDDTAATGAPVAVITVAALDTGSLVVVEGTSAQQLQDGPGHLRTTVLPGQQGWSTLFGRSVSYGAPIAGIDSLREGTAISVTTGQGRFRFEVSGVRRDGDPAPAAPSAGHARLTLVTSAGGAPLAASRTVFVDADLVGTPAAAHSPTTKAAAAEQPLATGASLTTVLELVLFLQLVIVALLASVWAWMRWSRAGAWVVGVPAVVAALWLCSGVAARLLPNLL